MVDTADKKWYALKVVSGKEKKIKTDILSEVQKNNLSDYVGQIMLPAERVLTTRNGKKKIKEKNLFPGYVFIEACLIGELPHIIKNIPNVAYFLSDSSKGSPLPLRKEEVLRMLSHEDEVLGEIVQDQEITFAVDDKVRVVDGPFNSFVGAVKQVDNDRKKLSIIVAVFGRSVNVEVDFSQVERM